MVFCQMWWMNYTPPIIKHIVLFSRQCNFSIVIKDIPMSIQEDLEIYVRQAGTPYFKKNDVNVSITKFKSTSKHYLMGHDQEIIYTK